MNGFDGAPPGPMECSPATPWGFHPLVAENVCPRCGWIARPGQLQVEAPDGAAQAAS